jgi:hypothetical protein
LEIQDANPVQSPEIEFPSDQYHGSQRTEPRDAPSGHQTNGISPRKSTYTQPQSPQGTPNEKVPSSQLGPSKDNNPITPSNVPAEVVDFFRSPSLTPLPPTPPRRRTRESNKNFAPYTEYIKQYGNKELLRLEEERRNPTDRWRHGDWGQDRDQEIDGAYVESQMQEIMSMARASKSHNANHLNKDIQVDSSEVDEPSTRTVQKSASKEGKDPVSVQEKSGGRRWNAHTKQLGLLHPSPKRSNIAESSTSKQLLDDEDLSRIRRAIKGKGRKEGTRMTNLPSDGMELSLPSKGQPSSFRHDMLKELYGDEVDDDEDDDLVFALTAANRTGTSKRVESVSSKTGMEDSSHSSPPMWPSSTRNHNITIEDEDESSGVETRRRLHRAGSHERNLNPEAEKSQSSESGEENSQSNSDSGDEIDRERERILNRIYPKSMVDRMLKENK